MNKFNKKRSIYITIAIVTILLIGLGYAFLTSNLNIIGNTNINKNTWGVEFENVQVAEGSVEADTPQISNKTTVNYTVTLDKPGDYYEFNVDAVNKGSIDAMIDTVSNTGLTTEQKKYLTYTATYSDGTEIKTKQELNANAKETIKVRVEYKKDITASDLPENNQTLNLTFSIEYVQKDDSSEPVVHPVCKRATTLHTETCHSGAGVCGSAGFIDGDTMTFGSLGIAGTLTAGDAFDCDVNGDGNFDSEIERFYYVTDLDIDSTYGVLIYYSNVSGGNPNNTARYAYDESTSTQGPITTVQQLPTTNQWKNVSLKSVTRDIKDENGNVIVSNFSYVGRAARLITAQEVAKSVNRQPASLINAYGSLAAQWKLYLENTLFSGESNTIEGYYIENYYSQDLKPLHLVYNAALFNSSMMGNTSLAGRPVIEVPKSKISY